MIARSDKVKNVSERGRRVFDLESMQYLSACAIILKQRIYQCVFNGLNFVS